LLVGSVGEEKPRSDKPAGQPVWTHAVRPKGEGHGWPESVHKTRLGPA
jgi:hypothetical protein